jgi:hypothetical protein
MLDAVLVCILRYFAVVIVIWLEVAAFVTEAVPEVFPFLVLPYPYIFTKVIVFCIADPAALSLLRLVWPIKKSHLILLFNIFF